MPVRNPDSKFLRLPLKLGEAVRDGGLGLNAPVTNGRIFAPVDQSRRNPPADDADKIFVKQVDAVAEYVIRRSSYRIASIKKNVLGYKLYYFVCRLAKHSHFLMMENDKDGQTLLCDIDLARGNLPKFLPSAVYELAFFSEKHILSDNAEYHRCIKYVCHELDELDDDRSLCLL